jgi:cobalt-zinc-cadmium efflux system outer membrane protein
LSEPEGPLTIDTALALARAHSPLLQASSSEEAALEARTVQAGKVPNPEIELRLQNNEAADTTDPDTQRWRVVLSQDFELGGKRQRRVDLAETERAIATSSRAAVENEIEAAVRADFNTLLGAARRVAAAQAYVDFASVLKQRVDGLVASGALPNVVVHDVGRELGLGRIALREAEAQWAAGRFRLAAHWGSTAPRFDSVDGDLERTQPIPPLDTVLALVREAPAAGLAEAELARGEAAVALARAEGVPDLTYGVGFRWDDDTGQQDYLVDVGIDIPIFDRNQGGVAAAEHELARARAARSDAAARMTADVAGAYYALVEAEARRAILADEVVPAARAAFDSQQRGFDSGAGNLDDLFDARRRLLQAENDHAEALVGWHEAQATLTGLIGPIGVDGN